MRRWHFLLILISVLIYASYEKVDGNMNVEKVRFGDVDNRYFNVMDYGAKGDGVGDDTKAIEDAIKAALKVNGTVYFPKGDYIISETIRVEKDDSRRLVLKGDGESSKIIGSDNLKNHMFEILLKYNFQVIDMSFKHNGPGGSCIYSVFLRAFNCYFESNAVNSSPLIDFHGSDCKIDSCTFNTSSKESFSIYYSMLDNEISINNYIVDNMFKGVGKGILVGDGKYTSSGRCEGLKINNNNFENTGENQIVIQEILHVDIANNIMKGSSMSAIVLASKGHGPDGIFINHNTISANYACIITEGVKGDYISMTVISDNILSGGSYGIYDSVGLNKCFIRDNVFEKQAKNAIEIEGGVNLFIIDNLIRDKSISVSNSEKYVIKNN